MHTSIAENLRVAGWQRRHDRGGADAEVERLLDVFAVLRDRLHEPAADLSGGQQQMLALAMTLVSRPRLLLVDELSLGLAPVVVERLADLVREVAAEGTTVVLVEQSVNVALTLADRAVFLERGRIRFDGPTTELLERPDLLRSVFLGGDGDAPRRRRPLGRPRSTMPARRCRFGASACTSAATPRCATSTSTSGWARSWASSVRTVRARPP